MTASSSQMGEESYFIFYTNAPVIDEMEAVFSKEGLTPVKNYVVRASEDKPESGSSPKDGFVAVIGSVRAVARAVFKCFCLQVNAQLKLSVKRNDAQFTIQDDAGFEKIEEFLTEHSGYQFEVEMTPRTSPQPPSAVNEPAAVTAVEALKAEFSKHCEAFRQDARKATFELFQKGLGVSSVSAERITHISVSHLQKGADFIFETIKEHVDWDLASANTGQNLREIFADYFNKFAQHVAETHAGWLGRQHLASAAHVAKVQNEAKRLVSANNPKIETLTKKSMGKKSKGEEKPSISIGTIHGNVQIGDYNSQQILSSVRLIEAAIDKSQASTQEKTEAKSLLQKILTNPLLASAIGGVVSGLTKAAVE